VLSNREAARLHSFPDWFRVHSTKWHGFRQIGNAVVPLVGRAVGASVVAALGVRPETPTEPLALGDVALLRMTMSQAASHFDADEAFMPAKRNRGASPGALPAADLAGEPTRPVSELVSA
jgi:DNA (cytosine-5)-methyltransferase 1